MFGIVEYLMTDNRYMSLVGIVTILGIAFLFSRNRSKIRPRQIVSALVMQFGIAFFILKTSLGASMFMGIAHGFESLYRFADQGCSFVFGNLANIEGPWGFVFAIKVVPIIIFFGALMALMYHLGVVQLFVKGLAFVIRPLLGTSGAETLSVAANSMLGQTEAPLLIKNYLARMTDSEILTVMVSGMAHLSGSILAVYGLMGVPIVHLLSASIMAIPGAILIAKMLMPEVDTPETLAGNKIDMKPETKNVLDALSSGTSDGLSLAVNVAAMLIAFISIMAMASAMLEFCTGFTLSAVFGKLFYGVAYLIGIPGVDCQAAGVLLGEKLVINEFVAYSHFIASNLTPRSIAILTYALAGFSNFSCIGIQIGGIGAICPEKRALLTRLGLMALLGGTLANLLNASIAGLFI